MASSKRQAKGKHPPPPIDGVDAIILVLITTCRKSGPWRLLCVSELADAMACSVGEASKRAKHADVVAVAGEPEMGRPV